MRRLASVAVVPFLVVAVRAQLTHTIPDGTAAVAGNVSNAFPWGTTASLWGGLRLMAVYDAANFTNATIATPIVISRLRWRADDGAGTWSGGTFATATIELSTAAVDWTQVTTSFASNHGPDRTVVYSGPVTVLPGSTSPGVVPPTVVDVALTQPFVYDPAAGDLVIDVDYPSGPGGANWSGGQPPSQMDMQSNAMAARVFASSRYPNPDGTDQVFNPVVQLDYVPANGFAWSAAYGTGCGGGGPPGFHELFDGVTRVNDLANGAVQLQPLPGSYIAIQGASPIVPPVGTPLAFGGAVLTQRVPLPWPFPHATGTTTDLWVCVHGWIALEATTLSDPVEAVGALRTGPARVCPFWDDLDPASGAVHAHVDATNVSLFHVTWTNVRENTVVGGSNTMQVTFGQNGAIELKWGAMTALDGLVGYHPGNGAGIPAPIDVSALTAHVLGDGRDPLTIAAANGSRPRLGQPFATGIRGIPNGASLGALVLGVAQRDPGLPLAAIGMPGCSQYASVDAVFGWVPAGATFTLPLNVPNAPAFAGASLYGQAAVWATGFNPLGVITSNGLVWHLDLQ